MPRHSRVYCALVFVVACGGTSSDGPVLDLAGKPGDQAAATVAAAFCEREVRCGRASISCSSSGTSGGVTTRSCSGTIRPVDLAACKVDVSGDLAKMFVCKPLAPAEAEIVKACFEPWIAHPCVTQSELDQAARTAEQTGTPPDFKVRPAACDQMVAQLETRCSGP